MENQIWNYWKFQIHWNNIEWLNPKIVVKERIHFVLHLRNFI